MKNNGIKPKNVNVAATQTQTLNVTKSKGVGGIIIKDSITYKDTTYTDSIKYNDYTIKKEISLIGVPQEFINEMNLPLYIFKKTKKLKKHGQRNGT